MKTVVLWNADKTSRLQFPPAYGARRSSFPNWPVITVINKMHSAQTCHCGCVGRVRLPQLEMLIGCPLSMALLQLWFLWVWHCKSPLYHSVLEPFTPASEWHPNTPVVAHASFKNLCCAPMYVTRALLCVCVCVCVCVCIYIFQCGRQTITKHINRWKEKFRN